MIYSVGNPPIFDLLQDVFNKNPTPILMHHVKHLKWVTMEGWVLHQNNEII
jgi:hypothetical protein